ncbi:MAG TPA: DNA polymerase III subunit delta [bacterium]|nr:DNA polymerase III subunit delta [bacterium]
MNWQTIWQQIEQKQLAPCYLLAGEESYLIYETVNRIEAALGLGQLRDINSDWLDAAHAHEGRLAAAVAQAPWMADRRLVVVRGIRPKDSSKKVVGKTMVAQNDLWDQLPALIESLASTVCLVLCVVGTIDKRTKVARAAAKFGELLEFVPLRGRELEQWIKWRSKELGLGLEPGALSSLLQRAGWSLAQLEQELDKLASYAQDGGTVSRHDIELLVSESRESRVFALTDAVLSKNREQALFALQELLRQGERPIGLVGLLAYQLRIVGSAKAALEQKIAPQQVAKMLKIHPYVAQKAVAQSRHFSWGEIYRLIRKLAAADEKLKSTSLEPKLVLEEAILL